MKRRTTLVRIEEKHGFWSFELSTIADEQTVKDEMADTVGEVTHCFTIPLNYCPYCGTKL